MAEFSFEDLVNFYLAAVRTVLRRVVLPQSVKAARILAMPTNDSAKVESRLLQQIVDDIATSVSELAPDHARTFVRELTNLLGMTDEIVLDSVQSTTLEAAAAAIYNVGVAMETIGCEDMSYNLFESSFHVSQLVGEPCFATATALRRLSNPANVDQHHSAIWRYATEALRHAIAESTGWLDALDATELALTVYTTNDQLQQQLCDSFASVLRSAHGTPVEALGAIYPVQVDRKYIEATLRLRVVEALAGKKVAPTDQHSIVTAMELMAVVRAQCMIDDLRQELIGRSTQFPSLNLDDLTLYHANLVNAVPLQRSLIVDVARTGEFAMQIAHEIAHAYCLVGPVGWVTSATRGIIHFSEAVIRSLLDKQLGQRPGAKSGTRVGDVVASSLSEDPLCGTLAEVQLAAALKAAASESAWMPWLEGVALYVELLADPKDNPHEIIAVHAAMRSLIDPSPAKEDGPDSENSFKKTFDKMAREFDGFLSRAIEQLSRLRHIGYTKPELAALRDVYVLGYLMVRAVVSGWETTLGRRILPIDAAKLLVSVTRSATNSVNWGFEVAPSESPAQAASEFRRWVESISGITAESIDMLLENVDRDSAGYRYFWDGPKPRRRTADNAQEAEANFERAWQSLCGGATLLASGQTLSHIEEAERAAATRIVIQNLGALLGLLGEFVEDRALLPVGHEMARIVLMEDGRALICPRTYVGLDSSVDPAGLPRYSIRWIILEGGAEEAEEIRRISGVEGTSRVLVTRVVDLVGHAASPLQRAFVSYVCLLHGEWNRISLGDNMTKIGVNQEFLDTVNRRVHGRSADNDKDLGSLEFLADRLHNSRPDSPLVLAAKSFDKKQAAVETALDVLSVGWSVEAEVLRQSLASALTDRARIHLADYLHATGIGKRPLENHPVHGTELAGIAFQSSSLSGIRPLRGKHE